MKKNTNYAARRIALVGVVYPGVALLLGLAKRIGFPSIAFDAENDHKVQAFNPLTKAFLHHCARKLYIRHS